jgi:hypothetical protein
MPDKSPPDTGLVENRKFPRTSVIWSGTVESDDGYIDCIAMNLSANGAKLQLSLPLDAQTRSWTLTIPRLGKFKAELAWQATGDGQEIGLMFQNPPGIVAQQLAVVLSKPEDSFIAA